MIEFYLKQKQNQSCKLQHNGKGKHPQNTPQSIKKIEARDQSRPEGKQICMVVVLGRAGLLEEAEELTKSMPVKPDAIIQGSLLFYCWEYENIKMTKQATKRVNELNPNESSSFVLLSNIYAAHSHFEEVIEQRFFLKEKQIDRAWMQFD